MLMGSSVGTFIMLNADSTIEMRDSSKCNYDLRISPSQYILDQIIR